VTGLRRFLYAAWYYGWTAVLCLVFVPAWVLPRPVLMFGISIWSKLLTWGMRVIGGVRVEIRGLERLPRGGVLLAAKHQSMFDIIPPFAFLPDACFVLKKELLAIPVFGRHCIKAGMIAVDREAHAKALRDLVAAARERLGQGRQLVIFPEGTRKAPGEPVDYKPGVAALYRDLGLACTPIATNSGDCLSAAGLVTRPGAVVFEILEPIPAGLRRGEFMRELQDRIEAASARLSQASEVRPLPSATDSNQDPQP
jgi:1-acyl-sn-glycerol-3-phosphate acyltransferase